MARRTFHCVDAEGHVDRNALAKQVEAIRNESTKGAAGHLRARDIVHVNTNSWRLSLVQQMIHGPAHIVITIALTTYLLTATIFAGAQSTHTTRPDTAANRQRSPRALHRWWRTRGPSALPRIFSPLLAARTGVFLSFGKGCYHLDDETQFDFASCLWISIHIFSTVGFGNLAPRQTCVKAQVGARARSQLPPQPAPPKLC
jgi:hypothetical protein